MIANWPPSYGSDVDVGEQGTERVLDPLYGQESTLFHAADILDRAVARAEDFRRVGGGWGGTPVLRRE